MVPDSVVIVIGYLQQALCRKGTHHAGFPDAQAIDVGIVFALVMTVSDADLFVDITATRRSKLKPFFTGFNVQIILHCLTTFLCSRVILFLGYDLTTGPKICRRPKMVVVDEVYSCPPSPSSSEIVVAKGAIILFW
jgi:hypothetical protein